MNAIVNDNNTDTDTGPTPPPSPPSLEDPGASSIMTAVRAVTCFSSLSSLSFTQRFPFRKTTRIMATMVALAIGMVMTVMILLVSLIST